MKTSAPRLVLAALALTALAMPAPSHAMLERGVGAYGSASRYVLQCVPYARDVTGIQIRGDAHTWWGQAAGKYARGYQPRVGAVMALRPHGNSRLGHVAAVSRIVDSRTILLSHANWSAPGMIERNVKAIDVSDNNDWSRVRIWFAPSQALGGGQWPVYGFIYKDANYVPRKFAKPPRRDSKAQYVPAKLRGKDLIGEIIAGRNR